MDVTFDLLFAGKYCSRAYYLLSTKEISYDHSLDTTFDMPNCPSNGNVLRTVSGTAELIAFLEAECRSGVTHSEVRLTKGFTSEQLMAMIKRKMTPKDSVWYNQIRSYSYSNHSRSLFVCWRHRISLANPSNRSGALTLDDCAQLFLKFFKKEEP